MIFLRHLRLFQRRELLLRLPSPLKRERESEIILEPKKAGEPSSVPISAFQQCISERKVRSASTFGNEWTHLIGNPDGLYGLLLVKQWISDCRLSGKIHVQNNSKSVELYASFALKGNEKSRLDSHRGGFAYLPKNSREALSHLAFAPFSWQRLMDSSLAPEAIWISAS